MVFSMLILLKVFLVPHFHPFELVLPKERKAPETRNPIFMKVQYKMIPKNAHTQTCKWLHRCYNQIISKSSMLYMPHRKRKAVYSLKFAIELHKFAKKIAS